MAKVTVLGSGGWGMALSMVAEANGHKVVLWTPFTEERDSLVTNRGNEKLLAGIRLPENVGITSDISEAEDSLITVIATPSFAVRETAKRLKTVKNHGIVTCVAKGFEKESLLRLSEVIHEEISDSPIVALSGPSHAEEVARGIPTMLAAASEDKEAAETVQKAFSNGFMRVYTNDDIIGVELGGAIKNVLAVAAGVCDGMGLGDNSKAALITRGLVEMSRLGAAMGAKEATFSGLAGLGDLIVTCTSKHSRNNRFGNLVGRGVSVEEALATVGTVEGYYAAKMTIELARKYNVSMPIAEVCYGVLYENLPLMRTVEYLMTRPFGAE